MIFTRCFIVISLLLIIGCGPKIAKDAAKLGVNFSWSETKPCTNVSPKIEVTNIPEGTVELDITMTDLDVPTYNHGGGVIQYDGSGTVPVGALDNYTGPCPPAGSHDYEFTIKAINKDGVVIGIGTATKKFP